jgi:hypothetical protein
MKNVPKWPHNMGALTINLKHALNSLGVGILCFRVPKDWAVQFSKPLDVFVIRHHRSSRSQVIHQLLTSHEILLAAAMLSLSVFLQEGRTSSYMFFNYRHVKLETLCSKRLVLLPPTKLHNGDFGATDHTKLKCSLKS